jgi:transcription initiation factor TFIIIB Brf1 subunit/transcription initiation factor TFIIB
MVISSETKIQMIACTDCGSTDVIQTTEAWVCRDCGIVLEPNIVDVDYRSYDDDDSSKKQGPNANNGPDVPSGLLGTMAVPGFRRGARNPGEVRKRQALLLLRELPSLSNGTRIGVHEKVRTLGNLIDQNTQLRTCFSRYQTRTQAACLVLEALDQSNRINPHTMRGITASTKLSMQKIRECRDTMRECDTEFNKGRVFKRCHPQSQELTELVHAIMARLSISNPEYIAELVKFVHTVATDKLILRNSHIRTLVSSTVWHVISKHYSLHQTMAVRVLSTISKSVDRQQSTVRNTAKQFKVCKKYIQFSPVLMTCISELENK